MRYVILAIVLFFVPPGPIAANTVEEEVERLLEAVGGRAVWADATGFTMQEILYVEGRELPVYREYWVDFETPRIMERATGRGLRQVQALNGDGGWTLRDGELSEWSEEQIAGWRAFWPGIPTRVFHLLASDDPSVEARLRDGVIDIYVDGERVVWIGADAQGTPVVYGREERHGDSHFLGRALPYDDVVLWSEAIEPGGDWRVVMIDYELLTEPHSISFDPPRG